MAVETELKLRITPDQLAKLKRHPLLKVYQVGRPVTRRLHNIYFDTPGLDLHNSKMALRLRRDGRRWLQTLKGGGSVNAGLHQRNEWEMQVAGEALDFDALQASGARGLSHSVSKRLHPIFVTDFWRNTRMLDFAGAQIELCMDSGEVRAGRSTRPICELELELKSGETTRLFKLALALLDVVPLQLEHISKAEYGYRLFSRKLLGAVKAAPCRLDSFPDTASALQEMIWSCLAQLQANVPGVVAQQGEEYLHQLRIALRRLRVALGMVNIYRDDDELKALNADVSALSGSLGCPREWDVFVTQTLAPIRAQMPGNAQLRAVIRASEKSRKLNQLKMLEVLQSQDLQRLLLRFGVWMHGQYWHEPPTVKLSLPKFTRKILQRHSKRVQKLGKLLSSADAEQLHDLRIACKKLRYTAELYAPLYPEKKAACYLARLTPIQDTLGKLNDIVVARRLLDELESEARHEMLALIRGWVENDFASNIRKLHAEWKRFAKMKVFWD